MLLTPAYQLVIGDREVDTTTEPKASTVEELVVQLDMDTPADSLTLQLGNVGGLKPVVDDETAVSLGYLGDEGLTLVLSGQVVSVDPSLPVTRIIAHSPAQKLLDSYMDKTFESKAAGEIVQELAENAGVTVAQADRGSVFPAYVIDSGRDLYHHIHDIAELSGYDFFFNQNGELVFRRFTASGTMHVFEYAKQIVELNARRTLSAAASVEAFGESPGTSQGSESWAWLTKDFSASKGTAGSGDPIQRIENPRLRTRQLAQDAADGAFRNIESNTVTGRLLTFGQPQILVGDPLRIKDVPDDRVDGDFQVRSVRHRISKVGGFTTEIGFRGVA